MSLVDGPSAEEEYKDSRIRTFSTGATRDLDVDKLKYAGFFNARVLHRYATYMHKHRKQNDGSLRDPDNWQKGIPIPTYADSLIRHVLDVWLYNDRAEELMVEDIEEALCAIMFNAQGMLFEIMKVREAERKFKERAEKDRQAENARVLMELNLMDKVLTETLGIPGSNIWCDVTGCNHPAQPGQFGDKHCIKHQDVARQVWEGRERSRGLEPCSNPDCPVCHPKVQQER